MVIDKGKVMNVKMKDKFLAYSAAKPMTILRKRFNNGENLYKTAPKEIAVDKALEDIDYVQYVLENAYSGYSYYDKKLFDDAFCSIRNIIARESSVSVNYLIDVISDQLSFICDGHLSFATEEYGRGFYKRTVTYVSDMLLEQKDGRYFETGTNRQIELYGRASVFQTVSFDDRSLFLVGLSSKNKETEIELIVDGVSEKVSVHEIRANDSADEILISEKYYDDFAVISCSTFVGESEQDLQKLKNVGEKCRKYRNVIWDLSNNLGGNSAFAEQFLIGLNGGYRSENVIRSLNSSLVYAKECGEIKEIKYHFTDESKSEFSGENLFNGTLHVIINNGVASSGELALVYEKTLSKVIFYGCNTLGIGQFGDLCIYYLPNSNITLWCPQKVFNTVIPETEGMKPDFWIDSKDVVSVVKKSISEGRF